MITINTKCEYGCGLDAVYQLKNGKFCCQSSYNKCPELRRKNSEGLKLAYKTNIRLSGREQYLNLTQNQKDQIAWNRGLTKETDNRVMNFSNSIKGRVGTFLGKKHSLESKQLMSIKANERNNGYVKTKYYYINCSYLNKEVAVQGTYELRFVKFLNENNIKWVRGKLYNLKYKLNEDDYIHTYYPDFYLIDSDIYIEIKGRWWKSEDGRVDDKRKMLKVIKYNPNKVIMILTDVELEKLNI